MISKHSPPSFKHGEAEVFGVSVFIGNKDPLLHLKSMENVGCKPAGELSFKGHAKVPLRVNTQSGVRAQVSRA